MKESKELQAPAPTEHSAKFCGPLGLGRLPVLIVRHLLQPIDVSAIHCFLNGEMARAISNGRAVPVLHAGRYPDDIVRLHLSPLPTPLLHPAHTGGDDQNLTSQMSVPCAAGAWLKGHVTNRHASLTR